MNFAPRLGFHWGGVVASSIAIETSGRIAIMNNPGTSYEAFAAGTITGSGNITAWSDIRLKTDIRLIQRALDKIQKLSGYTFARTDLPVGSPRQTGVIAQQVLEVLPEAVDVSDPDCYSVAYGNMVGLLVEGIKELRAEVLSLREELDAMQQTKL